MKYWAHKANRQGEPIGPRLEARDEGHAEELAGRFGYVVRTGDYQGSLEWRLVVGLGPRPGWSYPTYLMARQGGAALDVIGPLRRLENEGQPSAAIIGDGAPGLELKDELGWRGWDIDWLSEPSEMGVRGTYDAEFHLDGPPPKEDPDKTGLVVQCVSDTTASDVGGNAADLTVVLPALYGSVNIDRVDPCIWEIAEHALKDTGQPRLPEIEDGPPIEVMEFSCAAAAVIWEVNAYAGRKGTETVVQVRGSKMERDRIAQLVRTGLRHRPRGTPEFSGLQAFGSAYAISHRIPLDEPMEIEAR